MEEVNETMVEEVLANGGQEVGAHEEVVHKDVLSRYIQKSKKLARSILPLQ